VYDEIEKKAATKDARREKIEQEAATITEEQIATVHKGLRLLSEMCDGALELDGRGFNKIDTRIGKSLAASGSLTAKQAVLGRMLVIKYQRQLPKELLEIVKP
jgi:hypothetical protein